MQQWPTHDQDAPLSWSIPCTTPTWSPDVPVQDGHGADDVSVPEQVAAELDGDAELVDEHVRVLVLGDRVAVVVPPGDVLVLTEEEATHLANTLDRANFHTGGS